uniref:uncharacterized protein LOC122585644 n=1 Tax=Erigeron canadensis TaxID=72917 RepID=UPI001CB91DAE|nr:uncharacterized protein LOC122585644 [Erigeron canadensis]XP_043613706.1 uncharacterized protein LOC122585644 [Erigeron canadensis]XP_043613707.1 uncharacterized protein LOC122585644 [Erigeron canadensis]XP_043613708.1 uncharacterized protein LOC122585644 [Erigeron canadensis]XP_043613709.1 uncharacterized protein LOC122585644 [Erigeron canadensis]XP_043613710.1 uncharacterized protein LOC122585644 [Erigeron canadensis]
MMVNNIVESNNMMEEDSPLSIQHYYGFPVEPPPPSTVVTHFCKQKLFLLHFNLTIPRQIMTLDEKYLRRCLQSIHMTANVSTDSPLVAAGASCDALFSFSSKQENAVKGSSPIVGSITGSTSIINLLNSSLLRHLPIPDDDNPRAIQGTNSLPAVSSQDTQMKRILPEDHIYGCNKRLVSFSSTNSTFSDPPSSSTSSSAYCQGMLHCFWNNGFPCYVFSVEDQKQAYTTHLSKLGPDYMYKFYSRAGKRETQFHDQESDLIGNMRVSTSFTPCSPETEIMETQFILCGTDHHREGGSINQTVKETKGLTKKVSSILKGYHNRRKTSSMFDGSVAIQDNSFESSNEGNLSSESSFPSNLELAAIILKDHIPYAEKKVEVGGWGFKFLKESGHIQKYATQSVFCRQDVSQQSSSLDVIVPTGIHGGPRTKIGGPSSLVERWRTGGFCDCGGWDIGCPLTMLNAGPNNNQVLHQVGGVFGRSNSFELFTQGSKQSPPVLELANIHDGLYCIHYQPTLSALQSLSIAVAIIHSHSPTLKPKVYRN